LASIAFHDPRLSSTSGGAETVTLQLISLLLGAGHQVAVVTQKAKRSRLFEECVARYSQLDCTEIEISDAAAKALPEDDPTVRDIRNCDHLGLESLCFNVAAQGFYHTHSFDVVVVSFIPDLALLQTQGRILLNVFGLPPNEEIALLERPLLERCHAMTFASHYTKQEFGAMFRMGDRDLGPVVHASVGLDFFDYQSRHGKEFDGCFAGRLTSRKGVHTILEAVDWAKRNVGRKISVAIAGDGPERQGLRIRATELGVAEQITWLGAIGGREVADVIDRSRCYLFPSLLPEAFGCGNIEAMARGVPVITTNLGGTSDYVRAGENALICAPASAESLGQAIERVLENPDLGLRLARAGLATASDFHPSKVGAKWLKVFASI